MKYLSAFFKLIRWKNLLVILLTQVLVWFCVLFAGNKQPFLSPFHFGILSFSTLLEAAAGYIINDYYDIPMDEINKPERVVLGKRISTKVGLFCYAIINILALVAAFWLSLQLQRPYLAVIQIFCIFLLLFYAAYLKRVAVWGNLSVALMTALTILILPAYEPTVYPYWAASKIVLHHHRAIINPVFVIVFYAFFAFMTTWLREIIKDLQDVDGDFAAGCQTLPIVIGTKKTNIWLLFIGILTLLPLLAVAVMLLPHWLPLTLYIILLLVFPLVAIGFKLIKGHQPKLYKTLSQNMKQVMLLGILSLLIYYWLAFMR